MKELLKNQEFLWEKLQKETRPIVLYGMGDASDKILAICENKNIKISGIFASDDFVRGQSFRGYTVKTLKQIEDEFSVFVVLLAFGTALDNVLAGIFIVNETHTMYAPDLPIEGGTLFQREFLEENIEDIIKVYDLLEDDFSKKTFTDILLYKATGKIEHLLDHTVTRAEMFSELFEFTDDEVFVDAGAYRGDTVEEFAGLVNGKYKKIFAFEPNPKNFKKLDKVSADYKNLEVFNMAVWDKEDKVYFSKKSGRGSSAQEGEENTLAGSIDDILKEEKPTYIKLDVEGAEKKAIMGSVNTIKKYKPKLLISLYHRTEDLFYLPLLIHEIMPEYKLYLRRNPGIPAWDINLIAL